MWCHGGRRLLSLSTYAFIIHVLVQFFFESSIAQLPPADSCLLLLLWCKSKSLASGFPLSWAYGEDGLAKCGSTMEEEEKEDFGQLPLAPIQRAFPIPGSEMMMLPFFLMGEWEPVDDDEMEKKRAVKNEADEPENLWSVGVPFKGWRLSLFTIFAWLGPKAYKPTGKTRRQSQLLTGNRMNPRRKEKNLPKSHHLISVEPSIKTVHLMCSGVFRQPEECGWKRPQHCVYWIDEEGVPIRPITHTHTHTKLSQFFDFWLYHLRLHTLIINRLGRAKGMACPILLSLISEPVEHAIPMHHRFHYMYVAGVPQLIKYYLYKSFNAPSVFWLSDLVTWAFSLWRLRLCRLCRRRHWLWGCQSRPELTRGEDRVNVKAPVWKLRED